jgi:hypothetical protein
MSDHKELIEEAIAAYWVIGVPNLWKVVAAERSEVIKLREQIRQGMISHDDDSYAVFCTACRKAATRTEWQTIDGGSVNLHWREVCAHCGHLSESLFN